MSHTEQTTALAISVTKKQTALLNDYFEEQDPFFLNFLLNPTPSADKLEQFFSEEEDDM